MSKTYISAVAMAIVFIAKLCGVTLINDGLTDLLTELFAIGTACYVVYRKVNSGEISIFGAKLNK